jgi:hypothetical protein
MGRFQPLHVSTSVECSLSHADKVSVLAIHFHDLHSGTFTKCPPLLPRPGGETTSNERCRPSNQSSPPVPSHTSSTFPFFCRFWCIAHEISSVFYSSPGPIHEHVPLAFAESKLRSLVEWAESLPIEVARSERMAHNVAEMQ